MRSRRSGCGRVFHKVSLKPGKPLWFGVATARGGRPGALVFGLPGNPVSGLVGFMLFVRPAWRRWPAGRWPSTRLLEGKLAAASRNEATAPPIFLRGCFPAAESVRRRPPSIETLDWAGSADLRTVAAADGFAVFPAGDRDLRTRRNCRLPADALR